MSGAALRAVGSSPLPRRALPSAVVSIDGTEVTVHSLTRSQALHLNTAFRDGTPTGDVDGAEIYILVHGADVTEAEAKAWRDEVDPATAGLLIDHILELSGMTSEDVNGKAAPDPS